MRRARYQTDDLSDDVSSSSFLALDIEVQHEEDIHTNNDDDSPLFPITTNIIMKTNRHQRYHPRYILGIMSTDQSKREKELRNAIRDTYLSCYKDVD